MAEPSDAPLNETPLAALHRELGARMVPFAGYSMPVQYPTGIIAEHKQVREAAGLFDVSHMGQAFLVGPDHSTTATALEALTPGDFQNLGFGRMRYTLLLDENGGIIDDLMVTRSVSVDDDGRLAIVVNAARKDVDYADLDARLPSSVKLERAEDRGLLALQGPAAARVMARFVPEAANLAFMSAAPFVFDDHPCHISRSGYTGEDGFEISMKADKAEAIARKLLADPDVLPIGLGARDSLRLEAGLCLYGHDIDTMTTPAEADLGFAVGKNRRAVGGFPGSRRILSELADGPPKKRVGLKLDGKAPARDGAAIKNRNGDHIGDVTSGGFGPSVGGPIAMGYVDADDATIGNGVLIEVRGKDLPATIVTMPFVPHRYFRKTG